jgi:MinD superfamily P-loop ATPase
MKEVVVVSGKGGTGKTTLLGYLASTIEKTVLADCDVDAPNLHLLVAPKILHREKFVGSKVAIIEGPKCTNCGKCVPICRYEAIKTVGNKMLVKVAIDAGSCEGCALCSRICPSKAIKMVDRVVGEWFISRTGFGKMVHALLEPGEENSGKLVAMVKQKTRLTAKEENAEMILIDGPPGIGCPVISTLSGADLVIIVTEPTESGLSDLQRIVELSKGFGLTIGLVTNKADLNEDITRRIEEKASEENVRVLGRIPYDNLLAETMAQGRTVDKCVASPAIQAMDEICSKMRAMLGETSPISG